MCLGACVPSPLYSCPCWCPSSHTSQHFKSRIKPDRMPSFLRSCTSSISRQPHSLGGLNFRIFCAPSKLSVVCIVSCSNSSFQQALRFCLFPSLVWRLALSTTSYVAVSSKRFSWENFFMSCAVENLSAARHIQCPLVNVRWTATTAPKSFRTRWS